MIDILQEKINEIENHLKKIDTFINNRKNLGYLAHDYQAESSDNLQNEFYEIEKIFSMTNTYLIQFPEILIFKIPKLDPSQQDEFNEKFKNLEKKLTENTQDKYLNDLFKKIGDVLYDKKIEEFKNTLNETISKLYKLDSKKSKKIENLIIEAGNKINNIRKNKAQTEEQQIEEFEKINEIVKEKYEKIDDEILLSSKHKIQNLIQKIKSTEIKKDFLEDRKIKEQPYPSKVACDEVVSNINMLNYNQSLAMNNSIKSNQNPPSYEQANSSLPSYEQAKKVEILKKGYDSLKEAQEARKLIKESEKLKKRLEENKKSLSFKNKVKRLNPIKSKR